jgi:adenylate kinase family enzyme
MTDEPARASERQTGDRPPLGGRISVVGNSGSGKTTMARALAVRLGSPHLELDAIAQQPNWSMLDDTEFRRRVGEFITAPRWVIDGNYTKAGVLDLVWSRADTIIWLDLPRPVVVSRVVRRSLRRLVTREELWNGNRERLQSLVSADPDRNVILWAWTNYPHVREKYERRRNDAAWAHLRFIRLRSSTEVRAWLKSVEA